MYIYKDKESTPWTITNTRYKQLQDKGIKKNDNNDYNNSCKLIDQTTLQIFYHLFDIKNKNKFCFGYQEQNKFCFGFCGQYRKISI